MNGSINSDEFGKKLVLQKKTRQRKLFVSGHMSNYHAGKLQQQKNDVSC